MLGFSCRRISTAIFVPVAMVVVLTAQTPPSTSQQTSSAQSPSQAAARRRLRGYGEATKADILRGAYGQYRSNNDLLFYHLDVRVDPEKKFVSGKNTIRFKMLKDDTRIQLDLTDALSINKILLGAIPLKFERDSGAVFVDFPDTLHAAHVYEIDFYYSGSPVQTGRFGGFTFGKDPSGHPWIYSARSRTETQWHRVDYRLRALRNRSRRPFP